MAEIKCSGAEQVVGATLRWREVFLIWGGGGRKEPRRKDPSVALSPSSLGDSTLLSLHLQGDSSSRLRCSQDPLWSFTL